MYGARPCGTAEQHVPKKSLWCTISHDFYPQADVVAGHIVPRRVGIAYADYVFRPGMGGRLMEAENCLLMHKTLEKLFDQGCFVLMPVDPREYPVRRWKVVVTDDDARDEDIIGGGVNRTKDGAPRKLGDLDGRELHFRTDRRPLSRFLYFHFLMSLMLLRDQKRRGHETVVDKLRTGKPWPTFGRYMRKSALMKLAKAVGDVDGEVLRVINDTSYESSVQLEDDQEKEFVRRLKALYEARDGYPSRTR
jgi:hypothetical protein